MSALGPLLAGVPKIGFGTYRLRKDHPVHRNALARVRIFSLNAATLLVGSYSCPDGVRMCQSKPFWLEQGNLYEISRPFRWPS